MRTPLALGLALCLAPAAPAQPAPGPAPAAQTSQPALAPPQLKRLAHPAISRQHLTAALLRFERNFRDHPPAADRLADVNRAYDAATMKLLDGDDAHAIEALHDLSSTLRLGPAINPALRFAASLQIATDPVVWNLSGSLDLSVTQLYPATAAAGPFLRIMANGGEIMSQEPIGGAPFWSGYDTVGLVHKAGQTGPDWLYRVEVLDGADIFDSVHLYTTSRSLDNSRDGILTRLKKLDASTPAIAQAASACRSRAGLLSDKPSPDNPAQFLADLLTLRTDAERECNSIVGGRDPYERLPGDTWRTFSAGGIDIPCRLYVPAACTDSTAPHPVLIALHAEGGDESMFLEAYGCGRIKQLADQHGFIVLCPRTDPLTNPDALPGLLDALALDYTIDPSRTYLLGHSSGASTAAFLAAAHPERIAAACCIAGYTRPSSATAAAPILVLTGSLDQIAPTDQIKSAADAAAKSGLPVECRTIENQGHTLIVANQLPAAIDWLVAHHSSFH